MFSYFLVLNIHKTTSQELKTQNLHQQAYHPRMWKNGCR